MAHLVHNEQVKLAATAINNLSVGLFLGGCLLPLLADTMPVSRWVLSIVAWLVSTGLHELGRRLLRRLREEPT